MALDEPDFEVAGKLLDQHVHHEQRLKATFRLAAFAAVVAVLAFGLVAVMSIVVLGNFGTINRIRVQDSRQGRIGTYATCLRGAASRAELHAASLERGEPALLRRRQLRVPIYDCSPSLYRRGAGPVPLAVSEQRLFVRKYRQWHGAVPVVRGGRVDAFPQRAGRQYVRDAALPR